jgi:hypothetical protein
MSETTFQGVSFRYDNVPEDGTIYLERLTQYHQCLAEFGEDLASLTAGWVGSDEGDELGEDQEELEVRNYAYSGGDRLIPNPKVPGNDVGGVVMNGYYQAYSGHRIQANRYAELEGMETFTDDCCVDTMCDNTG